MNKTVQMMLAERFPVFAPEKWQAHWPLKVGMYLIAVIAGGNRFDLDGNVAGEIEPSDIEGTKAQLAALNAAAEKAIEKATAERRRGGRVLLTGADIDTWKAAREQEMSAGIAAWRERRARGV